MPLDETTPETMTNLAVECVREGFGTPKVYDLPEGEEADEEDPSIIYEKQLKAALQEAQAQKRGIHADVPFVRQMKNAGDSFDVLSLVNASKKLTANGKIKCVIEYVFDGSRVRCHVTDPNMGDLQYGSFTLLVGGIQAPRLGNPQATPPTVDEPFSQQARNFVETRLLQRELEMTLHGTDKSGVCVVGTIHHPRGNIAVELLKNGLAKMSDWSVRIMNPMDVPALRIAENGAKVSHLNPNDCSNPKYNVSKKLIVVHSAQILEYGVHMLFPLFRVDLKSSEQW
jgi:staphylococcal nuclease domain-containing protein 1